VPLRDLLLSWQQSEFEAAAGTEGIIIWGARVHKQFLLFFDKQRHAASAFCHTLDHFLWQRVTGRLVLRPCAGPVSSRPAEPARRPSPTLSAVNCRRLNFSGGKSGTRSAGSGISSSGPSRTAFSPASRLTCASELSKSASRCSVGMSAPPKRVRPHSAMGCNGVFCNNCEPHHSTQVCGTSRSRA
jgi:hypothetical protein